ncbi:MAG: class I SAM-dependent methyltransferase [Clostridiales bacterium]|nr:class I SAM-dependent methyltransferase [Clostridiales bacterium]
MDRLTCQYYNDNQVSFFDSTVNADVSDLYDHFLKLIPINGSILDLGCGSGRDTKFFLDKGYSVDAIDGSPELCELASRHTGIRVQCKDFSELNDIDKYDGIWACASLLHVSYAELPIILKRIHSALKIKGKLYLSFKYGDFEGVRNGRYFTDINDERFDYLIEQVNDLYIVEKWYSIDVRPDHNVKWFNAILSKGRSDG